MLQILRRQIAPDSHESKVDGLFTHAPEVIVEALLIVGTNRSNPHRGAVEHPDINAIFPRVDQHVAIFPQHHTCTHAISLAPESKVARRAQLCASQLGAGVTPAARRAGDYFLPLGISRALR